MSAEPDTLRGAGGRPALHGRVPGPGGRGALRPRGDRSRRTAACWRRSRSAGRGAQSGIEVTPGRDRGDLGRGRPHHPHRDASGHGDRAFRDARPLASAPCATRILRSRPRRPRRARRGRLARVRRQPLDPEEPPAEHRPPGRRGRVPVQHAVRVPQGRARRRRHAGAGHRRDEGQPGDRDARHHGGRQDERHRHRVLQDARRRSSAWTPPTGSRPKADEHYSHDLPRSAYRFRGVATGHRRPPKGYRASDFRVPTLREVMRAFPQDADQRGDQGPHHRTRTASEYLRNAEILAKLLKHTKRRDLIVVSFQQPAVDRFHAAGPEDRPRAGHRRRRPTGSAEMSPGPGRGGLPGADHVQVRPDPARGHHPARTWPARTPRATPGRTGSGTATPTRPARGESSSTCAWTAR